IRWFLFDNGGHVDWKMDPAGQPGLGPDASLAAFQSALAAWTADPTSSIDYEYAGTTTARSGLSGSDGVSALLFADPGDASVPGSYSCKTGGVLAMGGPFYYLSERSWAGRSYHEAIEADVVTNDGADCFFRNNPIGLAEVLGHELGHTLGLGHSADPEAMMYAVAHNDGRGAHLGNDDRMAVNRVYGDGTLQIAAPPAPAPLVLSAQAVSRTRIDLAWTGDTAQADRTIVEQQVGKRFRLLQTLAAGARSVSLTVRANATYVLRVSVAHGKSMIASSNLVSVRVPR
ncbi:MAG TPA: matrixin family metalloprotease, partial [Thermoanaerobaculia bacterium]